MSLLYAHKLREAHNNPSYYCFASFIGTEKKEKRYTDSKIIPTFAQTEKHIFIIRETNGN